MRRKDQQASSAPPEPRDALVWPIPVADTDILWLDSEPHPQQQTEEVAPPIAADRHDFNHSERDERELRRALSLSEVLASGVLIEWHDAVAVVSQLADQVVAERGNARSGVLPALGAIQLHADGRVTVPLSFNSSEALSAGFGRVLQAFLQDKPAPANLRLLAWRTTAAAGASLDDIRAELARWERPGRDQKLRDLYERARSAAPYRPEPFLAAPVDSFSAPLTLPRPLPPPPAPADDRPAFGKWLGAAMAAALFCIALGGTGAWLLLRSSADAPEPTVKRAPQPPASHDAARQPVYDRSVGRAGRAADRPSPVDARTPAKAQTQPPQPRRQDVTTAGTPAPTSQPLAVAPERPALSAGDIPGAVVNQPLTAGPATRMPEPLAAQLPSGGAPDLQVYKSGDAGVVEPVLVKPYLPPRPHPPIPDSAMGVLEVIVDARGLVESAHLKSPANRYREKWWLFTAKDWRFEPATKNGVPVRFLKRILLTDLNLGEPQ